MQHYEQMDLEELMALAAEGDTDAEDELVRIAASVLADIAGIDD